ncbi:Golgi apparatus membrane protein TVP38 [Pleurotus eryngii]|uniref:Golgi apparatus membrane protein TVP38 n=1 Tax=Pleurotus eryngii TaxID=5323 RepID=A0A9P6DI66_PLEER|nr:Golgi apparatus membrane protein TVP38 [Pleurotus eryngii]
MSADPSLARRSFKFIRVYGGYTLGRYQKLHARNKALIWLLILFYICIGIAVLVITPGRIAQFLYDKATWLASTRFGWMALFGAMVLVSFPPMIGHTTLVTLCGFAYGMKGFYIASTASVFGSALSFTVLRLLLSRRLREWSRKSGKWQALESVVRAKGLPLIILVRVSPLPPWVYSNSLFASIEAVSLWQFVVATLFVFPKLVLHVFIGSRIAPLADGDQRGHMDTQTKLINSLVIVLGISLAIGASWAVFTLVQKHIRHLDGLSPETDELAAEALEDYDEEAPLLSSPRSEQT